MSCHAQNTVSIFGINLRTGTVVLVLTVMFVSIVIAVPAAQAQKYHVIYTFAGGADGGIPEGALTIDRAGNLYGTTSESQRGPGTVFELSPRGSGWILTPLYGFSGGSDGGWPVAGVVFGPDGTLYGTTLGGGVLRGCPGNGYQGCGTVFNLRPRPRACTSALCPWTETVLYAFGGGSDGWNPWDEVTFDQAGNLYGTTYYGGTGDCYGGCGTVFKLTHSGGQWTKMTLYGFAAGSDGADPIAGVTFDSAGNLYGATTGGGSGTCSGGCGTIFELTLSNGGWTEQILYSFPSNSDNYPTGSLIFDSTGKLYGTTEDGPAGSAGTAFELTSANGNWTFGTVYNLPGNGVGPFDGFVMDSTGNLYGSSQNGGAYGLGSVFKLTPSGGGWLYTDLHDFTGYDENGAIPIGGLALDANGNIYGTTTIGGNLNDCYTGCGVVFEITP
jgi:uncharacterized repeat protein (TIGR03803 family)